MAEAKIQRLEKKAVGIVGQSYRKLAKIFKVSHEYIMKIFRKDNIVLRKKKIAPKYSQNQLESQKALPRKLKNVL